VKFVSGAEHALGGDAHLLGPLDAAVTGQNRTGNATGTRWPGAMLFAPQTIWSGLARARAIDRS